MGRPIRKDRMSTDTTNDGDAGKLEVTAYFPVGGSLQQNDNSFIISQRGSKQFKIRQYSDSSDATLTLKAVAPASLAAGEFCVQVILSDSTVAYVEKFYNRTVHYVDAAGNTGHVKYTLGTEGTDDTAGAAGTGSIDVL
jgi:hypothetical protein